MKPLSMLLQVERKKLGHKNLQTTLRYAEQADETSDAAVHDVEDVTSKGSNPKREATVLPSESNEKGGFAPLLQVRA